MQNSYYLHLIKFRNIQICLDADHSWIISKEGAFIALSCQDDVAPIFWLPILEGEYQEFYSQLKGITKKLFPKDDAKKIIDSFPIDRLIKTALKSGLIYWVPLGLKWLANIHEKSNFETELLEIINNKKHSQKVRHKAMKLVDVGKQTKI